MTIFPRRLLQARIDELNGKISPEALKQLVKRLNLNTADALGFEWELMIVSALARIGSVDYEAQYKGATRPDILFSLAGSTVRLAMDIRLVSDDGLHEHSPVGLLDKYLRTKQADLALPGGFNVIIESHVLEDKGGAKPRLRLPHRSRIVDVLDSTLGPWLQSLARERPFREAKRVQLDDAEFSISYDARSRVSSFGHLAYTAPYAATRNPVYSAFKAKASQLRKAQHDGPLGIILCDGGCDALAASLGQVSLRSILNAAFERHPHVAFALAIWTVPVGRARPEDLRGQSERLSATLVRNETVPPGSFPLTTVNVFRLPNVALVQRIGERLQCNFLMASDHE